MVSSSFLSSITSRSPAGTVTVLGSNLIPTAATSTVVVSPVAVTPLDSSARRRGEEGSAASAVAVVRTTTSSAASPPTRLRRPPGAISGRRVAAVMRAGFTPASRAAAFSRITASCARTARIIRGMNRANPRNASDDPTTRVQLVPPGARYTSNPALISISRNTASRFISTIPARTAAGPPRITVGMRKLIAPNRIWAAAPASSGVVTVLISFTRPAATSQVAQPSAMGSHTRPHAMLIDANSRGGAVRAVLTRYTRCHSTAAR